MAESRMNLATLQQRDPYITEIADTASQVALYSFSSKSNEWEKTSIEGSLFVYKRSATPLQGFMILNRLGLNNLIEPITKDLEFQVQDPFLLYRNAKNIYGIWFYEKDECARIGNLMNKFLHVAVNKDQTTQGTVPGPKAPEPVEVMKQMIGRDKTQLTQPGQGQGQVDIMQMLTKAQSEYVKQAKGVPSGPSKVDKPRPMTDHITTGAPTSNVNLVRPTPVKYSSGGSPSADMPPIVSGNLSQGTSDSSGPMTLEALFRKASISQQRGGMVDASTAELPDVTKPSVLQRSISMIETDSKDHLPPMLQKLISTGQTVEDIERQQISHNIHERPRSEGCDSLKPDGTSPVPMQEGLSHQPLIAGLQHLLAPGSAKHHPTPGSLPQAPLKPSDITMSGDAPLLKPSDIEQGGVGLSHSAAMLPSTLLSGESTGIASASVSCPDVLLSPMAFSSSHDKRRSPPIATTPTTQQPTGVLDRTQSDSSEPEQPVPGLTPLTKDQLQQALVHLIRNDNTFLSNIHEAYLKSFQALTGHKS